MRPKQIIPREKATQDVEEAITYYLGEGSTQAALGFVDSLEAVYAHISRHPSTGSQRYAHELNLPGLRSWVLNTYPYVVFYLEHKDHIDVWRVLQAQRDIPNWLIEPPENNSDSAH